jgi:CheY-like chemotaxis protein
MKIFISSTYCDLVEHRQKVAQAIARLGQHGVGMEIFGARTQEATEACLEEIVDADVFVGVYAHRYGHVPDGSVLSITEMEYDYAVEHKKPFLGFIVDEDYPWRPAFVEEGLQRERLKAFKNKKVQSFVCDTFTTPDELAFKVAASLGRYLLTRAVKEKLDTVAKKQPIAVGGEHSRSQVARRAERLSFIIRDSNMLIVNDIPTQMQNVISIFESLQISVTIATTTAEALSLLSEGSFHLVISDMSRDNIPDEGLRFLEHMRKQGWRCPIIFTVGHYEPERGTPAYAFGITNRVDELLNLSFDILERVRG